MLQPQELTGERRPTIRTIAKATGLSSTAVSMALRNHPEISADTRRQVQQVARELGYRPDPEVAKLMHHLRSRNKPRFQSTIAALTSKPGDDGTPYTALMCKGAQQAAEALGYGFSLFHIDARPVRNASLQRILKTRGVEGVLLLPMARPESLYNFLDWDQFSTVAATHSVSAPALHRVLPDQFGNTLTIARQLTRMGHRRIGLILHSLVDAIVGHRFSAAIAWQNAFGGTEPVSPLVHDGDFRPQLREWFARERPDAIIAGLESEARLIAGELALSPGGPARIVLTDWHESGAFCGLDQRADEIGTTAMRVLHDKIQRGEKGVPLIQNTTLVSGSWMQAATARAATLDVAPRVQPLLAAGK